MADNTPLRCAWLIVAGISVTALGGCMSSGASSFTEPSQARDLSLQTDPLQEIRMDVANEPVALDSGSPQELALAAEPPLSTQDPDISDSGNVSDSLTTSSLVPSDPANSFIVAPRNAASPQAEALRSETEARLASLGQTDDRNQIGRAEDLPSPEKMQAEQQAEQRIPALFSSIKHGQCKGGWGPKPKMLNVSKVDPDHRYYMEMRMRHTPLLPVGHVYIAYGRLGPDGTPMDERLTMLSPVGGYVGAGIAGAVPMPGILVPVASDCSIQPEAAYRLSLSAADYEKLLLAIREQHRKRPAYHLFAHNCNHYMSEVAASVGILPPKNIYQASLTYFYAMMDRNEGYKVPRTPGAVEIAENQEIGLGIER